MLEITFLNVIEFPRKIKFSKEKLIINIGSQLSLNALIIK